MPVDYKKCDYLSSPNRSKYAHLGEILKMAKHNVYVIRI